jgi:hypothetical protein
LPLQPARAGVDWTSRAQKKEESTALSRPVPAGLPTLLGGGLPIPSRQNASERSPPQGFSRGRTYITEDVTTPLKPFLRRPHAPSRDTHPRDAVVDGSGASKASKMSAPWSWASLGSEVSLGDRSILSSEIDGSMLSPQTVSAKLERKNTGPITYAPDVFAQVHHKELEDKYNIVDWIGNGSGCSVCVIQNKDTNMMYACKCMDKVDHEKNTLLKEIEILKKLDHPNIVKLYETLESEDTLFLIMELCHGGDLFDRIRTHGTLSEEDARTVMRQALGSIAFCNANNVVHSDVKPENFLLESSDPNSLKVKLSDLAYQKPSGL